MLYVDNVDCLVLGCWPGLDEEVHAVTAAATIGTGAELAEGESLEVGMEPVPTDIRKRNAPPKQDAGADKPWVRLSINLAPDVAAALRDLTTRHRTTITEEVRRAISVYKFIDDQIRGQAKVLVEKDGEQLEVRFF
jgi:hypothetical protein